MNCGGLTRESLGESRNDDDHEFNTVCGDRRSVNRIGARPLLKLTHPLTTDDISQPTKQELSNQGTDGGGDFDAKILIRGELTT